jgi:predicted chitinase
MMRKYGIVTALRRAHLFGQVAAETGRWRTMVEAGDDDYFKKYEPRTDQGEKLGNSMRGDGKRFKGRGLIQLTGRYSYAEYGKFRACDFLEDANSLILQNDGYSTCDASGYYWASKQKYIYGSKKKLISRGEQGINYWADFGASEGNISEVTKRINPGLNHFYIRIQCFNHALDVFGDMTIISADFDVIEEEV